MNKKKKFLLQKAIEAKYEHINFYNHWMNMFAIFNGALFVGLYTAKEGLFLQFLTVLLGTVAGWCWHFSSKGFYDWLLSYIKIIQKHEKSLKIKGKDKIFYIFFGKFKNGNFINPYSTQKLIQTFTLIVAFFWTAMTIHIIMQEKFIEKAKAKLLFILNNNFALCLMSVIVITSFIYLLSKFYHEHLKEDGFPLYDIKK